MNLSLSMPWITPALFGLIWLMVMGSNIASLIDAHKQSGTTSLTLFLGGIFGAIAVIACPIQGAWIWFWVPILLDPGSLPAAAFILYAYWKNNKS